MAQCRELALLMLIEFLLTNSRIPSSESSRPIKPEFLNSTERTVQPRVVGWLMNSIRGLTIRDGSRHVPGITGEELNPQSP